MDAQRLKAELESKRKPGAVLERLRGLGELTATLPAKGVPHDVRAIVEEALTTKTFNRFNLVGRKRADISAMFAALGESDHRAIIRTLLPTIAPSVESGWDALVRRPYQEGPGRKPFRSTRSTKTLAGMRGRWLLNLTLLLGEYDADVRWIAEHAAHLAPWVGAADVGWLLAGAIDLGGETGDGVFAVLRAAALGEHDVAEMGRHVTQALMSCGRPDAWELVERMLLAAQRQEGVRQVILESVDEAHPQAFRRMLRLIRDENLTRFSSVVRAADVWFGFQWDGASAVKVDSLIERVLRCLDDESARTAAFEGDDAESAYLALWSTAFDDVDAALAPAKRLLTSPAAPMRFAATHFLVQATWTGASPKLMEMLADPDLNVATRALDAFRGDMTKVVDGAKLFDHLEALMARVPRRAVALTSPVWSWWNRSLERSQVAAAMVVNSSAVGGDRVLPHVPELTATDRAAYVRHLAGLSSRRGRKEPSERKTSFSANERSVLLELMGDPASDVRAAAFEAMRELPVMPDETERLIQLLDRKAGDLRSGCLTRLARLGDDALLGAADRLLADGSEARRVAGLELLRDASEAGRMTEAVRERVERYAASAPGVAAEGRGHVDAVLADKAEKASLDDALGLVDPAKIRQWPAPQSRDVELDTAGARASLTALAELVLAHQNTEVRLAGGETKLLVEMGGRLMAPRTAGDPAEKATSIPLVDMWRAWVEGRPASLRDPDGLELLRAIAAGQQEGEMWKLPIVRQVIGLGQYHAGALFLGGLLRWCAVWDPPRDAMTFLLDGVERAMAEFSVSDLEFLREQAASGVSPFAVIPFGDARADARKRVTAANHWTGLTRWWKELFPTAAAPHIPRFYGLVREFERRSAAMAGVRVRLGDFVEAYRAGVVDEDELIDLLAGKLSTKSQILREASTRKPPRGLGDHPPLLAAVDRVRRRIVEVEVQRGDRESAASRLATELRTTGGLDTLAKALPALGKTHFARHFSYFNAAASRQETLSHLVLRSIPREEDTPEAFASWVKASKVGQARLVELAVYAPQWASRVNHVLDWPGLESAVWWVQAHTKDDRSWQLRELKELWAAEVSERTPLSAGDLTEGAVDVVWFRQAYETLGAERWQTLDTAAKYAASNAGHTRAQLFARAMSGATSSAEILDRMTRARHQDSVRALGLVPLPVGEAGARELLTRYQALQAFHREARKFGSQRQASERRAVAIGLANLARTAGYRDPQRLTWAMEQAAVADLARGPVVLARDDATLTLAIDADGVASLTVTKNEKPLKSIPTSLRKDAEVEELKERLAELRRQRSRVRDALEEAMCRGDRFSSAELRTLFEHPVLAPSVAKLVFIGDGVAGYPTQGGRVLRDHAGETHILGNNEEVCIAHPHDLFTRGDWGAWQRECFAAERVQPFKQLFREIYPLTDSERDTLHSSRYAGHQVNPRQALALLGSRGWVVRPDEGVSRTFHDEGLTVRLSFQETFMTPAEIEGLTLENVAFTKKGEWAELELSGIPPRVFSEAMRDLDLVVSVAHRGGVDPEATASTVEMRGALVRETTSLLGLDNVEVLANHAIVRGTRGTYSVHLGSANVLLLPGTALPIVAVHSQHRGRLFLPFADDDPRTAEVLSKVLLLARDKEIKDPNILEWIRAAQHGPAM